MLLCFNFMSIFLTNNKELLNIFINYVKFLSIIFVRKILNQPKNIQRIIINKTKYYEMVRFKIIKNEIPPTPDKDSSTNNTTKHSPNYQRKRNSNKEFHNESNPLPKYKFWPTGFRAVKPTKKPRKPPQRRSLRNDPSKIPVKPEQTNISLPRDEQSLGRNWSRCQQLVQKI